MRLGASIDGAGATVLPVSGATAAGQGGLLCCTLLALSPSRRRRDGGGDGAAVVCSERVSACVMWRRILNK